MRLRTRIQAPERFEDADHNTSAAINVTKPAFPRLLKVRTSSFDPHLPPAAFPSLPQACPQEDGDRPSDDPSEPADVHMMDTNWPLDHVFLPIVHRDGHLGTQTASVISPSQTQGLFAFGGSFLDDAETSDEAGSEIQQVHGEATVAHSARRVRWTQLAPALQVEIFENLCDSRYGHATYEILELSGNELYDIMKHSWIRKKQMTTEDHGIQQLQQAQLQAILRKDHSSSLTTNSWRDHVAYTRRHLPHISATCDYFICKEAEVEMAREFLIQRGIDTRVLGEWGRNKKDEGLTNLIQTQAVRASKSRDGEGSGHTSEVAEEASRHVSKVLGQVLPRNALSEISNSTRRGAIGPPSLRRKRSQPMPEAGTDAAIPQAHSFGPSILAGTSSAPPGLQVARSTTSLRVSDSGVTSGHKTAVSSMMKTRGGGFEDSGISYEDENERHEAQSLRRLKINPPKPPPDKQDPHMGNASTSPGQRAITLKISPKNLEKVKVRGSSNVRLSSVGPYEVLTPPTMTNTWKSIKNTPMRYRSRHKQIMPAARQVLKSGDSGNLSAWSRKLLDIGHGARGAGGLSTSPVPSVLPSQQSDHQTMTPPKRPKLNQIQDVPLYLPDDDTQSQSPDGSSPLKRNDSTSFQEAPPWSPITQASSISRPPSRREPSKDESQSYKLSSADSSNPALPSILDNETQWIVPTNPQTPRRTKSSYRRPSIAENGSPVLDSTYDDRNSSALLPKARIHSEAEPKDHGSQLQGSSHSSEPPQTLRRIPSNAGTLSYGSVFGTLVSTDPHRTYATVLPQDLPNGSQSPPSRRVNETVVREIPTNAPPIKKLGVSPRGVSRAEQSKIDAILKSPEKPYPVRQVLDNQLSEASSKSWAASPRKQSPTGEDDLPTRLRASSVKKGTEAAVAATTTLQESPQIKTGKDGKVRPRTYTKSEKQMQKEAANAAAKAAIGNAGVAGKKRTEGQKTDEKAIVARQTTKHGLPASQIVAHIGATLMADGQADKSGHFDKRQMLADPKKNKSAEEDLQTVGETSIRRLPEAVTASKQKKAESSDSKAARSTKKEAADDESYEEDETSDASIAVKKIASPKGKKIAVDQAKAAVRGYQTVLARRGKSALTDMTPKRKPTPKPKAVHDQGEAALKEKATHKLEKAAAQQHEGRVREQTNIAEADEIQSQEATPLRKKIALKTNPPPVDGGQSAAAKKKKKSVSLAVEGSVLAAEGEGRTKAFRGNQYLNADGTPRVKKDGGATIAA